MKVLRVLTLMRLSLSPWGHPHAKRQTVVMPMRVHGRKEPKKTMVMRGEPSTMSPYSVVSCLVQISSGLTCVTLHISGLI